MNAGQRLALVCQALGDTNRLRILEFLGGERRSVSEITAALGVSQPLASHHLKAMREQGLLETKREGPFVYYAVRDPRLAEALALLAAVAGDAPPPPDGNGPGPPPGMGPPFGMPRSMKRRIR